MVWYELDSNINWRSVFLIFYNVIYLILNFELHIIKSGSAFNIGARLMNWNWY